MSNTTEPTAPAITPSITDAAVITNRHFPTVRQSLASALDLVGPAQVLQILAKELEARSVDAAGDVFEYGSDDEVCTLVHQHCNRVLAVLDRLTSS